MVSHFSRLKQDSYIKLDFFSVLEALLMHFLLC